MEDDGETLTEVREETTTKQDGAVVEEKKEVRTTTKTTTADGGKMTTKTTETRTKKTFMGELKEHCTRGSLYPGYFVYWVFCTQVVSTHGILYMGYFVPR